MHIIYPYVYKAPKWLTGPCQSYISILPLQSINTSQLYSKCLSSASRRLIFMYVSILFETASCLSSNTIVYLSGVKVITWSWTTMVIASHQSTNKSNPFQLGRNEIYPLRWQNFPMLCSIQATLYNQHRRPSALFLKSALFSEDRRRWRIKRRRIHLRQLRYRTSFQPQQENDTNLKLDLLEEKWFFCGTFCRRILSYSGEKISLDIRQV